jgi:hypothetical protein
VRVGPGVVQVDGGRPVNHIQALRRWAIVRRVLSVAAEGCLRPRLADQRDWKRIRPAGTSSLLDLK